jgi:hypothetical protein
MAMNTEVPPAPKPNGPGPYPEFPIDGGISFLLIAGAAYGIYALKKNKKSCQKIKEVV